MHRRADVVATALDILASVGLPDLTMRQLGAELGVRQSAIYHHFANKQALLGAVADEILARGPRTEPPEDADWSARVRTRCADLHAAVRAYPDGADVVMSMDAFGLGGRAAYAELAVLLAQAPIEPARVPVAARTLLHYVYGHAYAAQSYAQAQRLGALEQAGDEPPSTPDDFGSGLDLILAGIAAG